MPSLSNLGALGTALAAALFLVAADGPASQGPASTAAEGVAVEHSVSTADLNDAIDQYCVRCHSERRLTGNLSLEGFDVGAPHEDWEKTERVIGKLRASLMPPPGARRPGADTLAVLAETLERSIDQWAGANPKPGSRGFQRLNQAEYARAVEDLLGLEIDPAQFLPPDQRSANFDNVADVQLLSPTLVTAYLNAAASVSRMALGDPSVSPSQTIYRASQQTSQRGWIEGTPIGSRGGMSRVHNFPADGEYTFRVGFAHSLTGEVFARTTLREMVEVSIDGERVALLEMDHWLRESDVVGLYMNTGPIEVTAGPHVVAAAFVKAAEGPQDDLLSPHQLTLADRHVGDAGFGVELLPHLTTLQLSGPFQTTGVSQSPVRDRILTCTATSAEEERPCAEEILGDLMQRAFRGTAAPDDLDGLMAVYDETAGRDGFEAGLRVGLQGILANPKFVFRIEEPVLSAPIRGDVYPVADIALASRLSFFLWNLPPDETLLELAREGRLNDDDELERQVLRMLADPRAEALGSRFASQWFRLHDLDRAVPDQFWFPDFNEQLRDAMRRETEQFFVSLVQENRSYFDVLRADYTYVNERLAAHYGIDGVVGDHMRRVAVDDPNRRGLLGHASILTATSFGNRTSVVNRGKWVLEVLLNTPPPPPPPSVPSLDDAEASAPGRILTSKARQELHIANPACAGCHAMMDPIGLPLEMFDPTGRYRRVERRDMGHAAIPLETTGQLWDGSLAASPVELRETLLKYPQTMTRALVSNLLTYALGRRMEYFDQPAIRGITARAAEDGYRMSSFFIGVVQSDPFRMMEVDATLEEMNDGSVRR
jgi:hypothetical protein